MKEIRALMGMPIAIEINRVVAPAVAKEELEAQKVEIADAIEAAFSYFVEIDQRFSTYKPESEISRINRGELLQTEWSEEMQEVFALSEETKQLTKGYFDIRTPEGILDPSGLVKGLAIYRVAELIVSRGFENFYVEAGGDIEARGVPADGTAWSVGIQNPFAKTVAGQLPEEIEIIKVVQLSNAGMATSGTYVRGQHIYNPHAAVYDGVKSETGEASLDVSNLSSVVSLTVIGPNVYEADRFATAAFAMGEEGINFIASLKMSDKEFEAYQINADGTATFTPGFENYTL